MGERCEKEGENPCDMSCYGHGVCDEETLQCDCSDGWRGPFCGKEPKADDTEKSAKQEKRERVKVIPPCPEPLAALEWWQRYEVPASGDRAKALGHLQGCETREEPQSCVEALVKLGEVIEPADEGCRFGAHP